VKKIIGGKAYNTDTATVVATSEPPVPINVLIDGEYKHIVSLDLCVTVGGAFFLFHRLEDGGGTIDPMTREKAMDWMERSNFTAEAIEAAFGEIPEAGEVTPIYLRVPSVLRQRLVKASEADGLSLNAWVMRCVERCLGDQQPPQPSAKFVV
jgi:hypothetical protein